MGSGEDVTIRNYGSNMTGTDCIVRTIQSVPVIFEPPCSLFNDVDIIKRIKIHRLIWA
jgi:hypothetical protein